MKINSFNKLILIIVLFSIFLNSCSLGLGAFTAVDNKINESWQTSNNITEVKEESYLEITMKDSSKYYGKYKLEEESLDRNSSVIKVESEDGIIQFIERINIAKINYIAPNDGFWKGFSFGIVIDALLIVILISIKDSDMGPKLDLQ